MTENKTAINAGIMGAIGLVGFTSLFHWLFCRVALADGQYGMFLMLVSGPLGAALGSVTWRCLEYARKGNYHRVSKEALIWSLPIILITAAALARYSGGWKSHDLAFNLGTFGLPLFWAVALLFYGLFVGKQAGNLQPHGR